MKFRCLKSQDTYAYSRLQIFLIIQHLIKSTKSNGYLPYHQKNVRFSMKFKSRNRLIDLPSHNMSYSDIKISRVGECNEEEAT